MRFRRYGEQHRPIGPYETRELIDFTLLENIIFDLLSRSSSYFNILKPKKELNEPWCDVISVSSSDDEVENSVPHIAQWHFRFPILIFQNRK